MRRKYILCMIFALLMMTGFGCSGGGDMSPLNPEPATMGTSQSLMVHNTWGMWQFVADPDAETLDVIQLRAGNMHLNALPFLEPPPLLNLSLESLEFNGDELYAGIGLRHPFLGLTEFTGFDVSGILISNGSITGFDDADIVMAGEGDTYLLNPDGYSRWWNPSEFPVNTGTIFSYNDGLLGVPDSLADFTSTINGYKFFCDDIDNPDDELSLLDPTNRCVFSAGQKNTRMFRIKLGTGGLVFNYAVDACWQFPQGDPPWSAPEDFGPEANRCEAWNIDIDITGNTLWNDGTDSGGGATLLIDVWDHYDVELNTVKVESPGNFDPVSSATAIDGGDGYSTYQIEITNATPDAESIDLLITVECEQEGYQELLTGKTVSAYFTSSLDVIGETPSGYDLEWGDETRIEYSYVNERDEEEATIHYRTATDILYIGFNQIHWDQPTNPTHRRNYLREAMSSDYGDTFGTAGHYGYWNSHGGYSNVFNNKITGGPDGYLWITYDAPTGHTLGRLPFELPYNPVNNNLCASFYGPDIGHAGEMLYTSEGYPCQFGDSGNTIIMRRGDLPNNGGTGDWPVYNGTEYLSIPDAWLSISRSVGLTSDGICRLVYWKDGVNGPIRMLSSDDISGTSWTDEVIIESGALELWDGAHDPSLWIDENDYFHVTYAGDTWMGTARVVYSYSTDGDNWTNEIIDNAVTFTDLALNDLQVVTFNAFSEQFILLSYQYEGDVYCQWKQAGASEFSDPILVSVRDAAALPDIYPNGADGATFAYQADSDYGDNSDIFYRTCNIVETD